MSLHMIVQDYADQLVTFRNDEEMLEIIQTSIAQLDTVISPVDAIAFAHEVYILASSLIDSMESCGCTDTWQCDKHLEECCTALYNTYMVGEGLN